MTSDKAVNRRAFLAQSAAFCLAAGAPQALFAQAARFRPTRFSVVLRGSGPDVLLIPGLASTRDVWNATAAAVPGRRYHLLQVAGFAGEPARGNARGTILAPLVDEIARYIRAMGLRRPAVVGHSMGGTVAMMLAARYPELVGKLMVVDMLPRPTALFGGAGASSLATALGGLTGGPIGRGLLSGVIAAFTPAENNGRESDPDVVARAMQDLGTIDLTGQLPRIHAPMTVVFAVRAGEGAVATPRAFQLAYRGARAARLIPVANSGHMIMSDQPARFAAALRDFLR